MEKAGSAADMGHKHGPVSLCDLAKDESMKKLYLVESNMVNFFSAYKNLKQVGCDLAFGLKVVCCDDIADKSDTSFKNESKVVIFMANDKGYKPLIHLQSKAATDGFYYIPRLDWKTLRAMWSDDLLLALPFYSSFLAKNTLTFATIAPDLPAKPILLREVGQQLPFDDLLNDAVDKYAAASQCEIQPVKSIYYKDRKDSRPFLTWRCVLDRKSWDKPGGDAMCSQEFSWEAYREYVAWQPLVDKVLERQEENTIKVLTEAAKA